MISVKKFFVKSTISIRNVLKKFNSTGRKCLIIVDENYFLKGTISDGDIRKAILKGHKIDTSIKNIYNQKCKFFQLNEYNEEKAKKIFSKFHLDLIPIINNKREIKHIVFWEKIIIDDPKRNTKIPVVIMAGGKGSRLEPFTEVLPKPLIPINNKTIIERIIENFQKFGCNNFFISINFKSKIIKFFFEEYKSKTKFRFIEEKKPLGTIGAIRKLKNHEFSNFLVTNCDIISSVNISELITYHKKNNYDITIVASTKGYTIPYGVCEIDNEGLLLDIREKPHLDFLINIGIYILKKDIIKYIPPNKYFDMTDLIKVVKKKNKKIGIFPVYDHNWVDVGQWSEYKKAIEKL